jgi:hypothetical protein
MKYSCPTINTNYPVWHLQCNESKNVNIWKTSADNETNVLMLHNTSSNFVTLIPLQKFSSSRDCNINKKSYIFEIKLGNSNQSNSHCLPLTVTM